jgi:acetyl esterase/lipase
MGSRSVIPGLAFDNIGAFFAQRGILTAVADYRLLPTLYPEPVKDIRDAIKFVISSAEVGVVRHGADTNKIYLAGHSVGAAHIMTLFLNSSILLDAVDWNTFKGAILIGGLYGNAPSPSDAYYGPEEDFTAKTPFGLLRAHSGEEVC